MTFVNWIFKLFDKLYSQSSNSASLSYKMKNVWTFVIEGGGGVVWQYGMS